MVRHQHCRYTWRQLAETVEVHARAFGCITHGTTMIYPNDGFDPLLTLTAVAEERATGLYGVPTMFIALLDHPRLGEFDLSSLRTGIMAGSTCPIDRSHALRGNAAPDALRHLSAVAETCSGWRDAERHRRHSHAEHGNDQPESTKGTRRSPLICRCVLFFYY
ncbi:Acetoacetyl-CoA synthetase [Pseudomonas sp. R2-37-08W]|nr:Acetoacetyl-CoA synthetase [Pseudomonas sp. R2-37-08W]